ncbi:MAG: CHASE2 domain-containing protein [Bacteroidota bacterium]
MASSQKRRPRWLIGLVIAPLAFILAVLFSYSSPFQTLELKALDKLFDWRGPLPIEDSPVVLVSISEQADDEIPYKWPWPTNIYAKLVENLDRAGARTIVFDVILDQPDRYDLSHDTLFAQAIADAGNVILAGDIRRETKNTQWINQSSTTKLLQPYPPFREANPNKWGLVSVPSDLDGFVRRYQFANSFNKQTFYELGLEAIRHYKDIPDSQIGDRGAYFQLGPYRIPEYQENYMLINYHGGPGYFPEYSLETVIDDSEFTTNSEAEFEMELNSFDEPGFGLLHKGVFEDKIVLIGATMLELHDFYSTPLAHEGSTTARPGYEVHANAIQTILSERYLYNLDQWWDLLMVFGAAMVVVFVTAYSRNHPMWGLLGVTLLGIGYGTLYIYAFIEYQYTLLLTGPLMAMFIGYVGTMVYDFFTEQKEKRRIKGMFQSYVSPTLVERMIESGEDPSLGGDELYLTAFFSDIQSFSTFSEKLEAKELVELINEYLTAMTDLLTDQGGTLDKYIGDAVVAFFGAPVALEDHAYRACVVSQLMQKKMADLRAKWRSEGDKWPEIVWAMQTRIGINTGWMVTGNMGSTSRFNYTMMGDSVNLAARCESGAKSYGVYTMVTEDTKQEAEQFGDRCVFRFLDQIVVKGRTQPVKIYEIVCLREDLTSETEQCIKLFEEAIKYYMDQDWDTAIELFRQSAELEPLQPDREPGVHNNPSLIFIERCKEMREAPPEEDWNGVYVMQSK